MRRALLVIWDGLRLRCPQCRRGRMFAVRFTMHQSCPLCGLLFERSSGEITGGMGINAFVSETVVFIVGAALGWFTAVPLGPLLGGLTLFAIAFPIAFYRPSRGLWASILYLTGDNDEPD
jgi:uncharacterized protein (DUF983 family)